MRLLDSEAVAQRQADQEQEQDAETAFEKNQRVDPHAKWLFTVKGISCIIESPPGRIEEGKIWAVEKNSPSQRWLMSFDATQP